MTCYMTPRVHLVIQSDDPALLLRESMGISAETTTRAFKEQHVTEFAERPRISLPYIRDVFLSVDPSGGGASAFAITSIGRLLNGDVVVRRLPCVRHLSR